MIAKTAEGLIGANKAMEVLNTPMKVFKEARARGDRETMDRAMGYVEKAHDSAWEYKYSADKGMKQEVEENKLKAEQQREELTQRIRENREELENRIEESSDENSAAIIAFDSIKKDTAEGEATAEADEVVSEAAARSFVNVKGSDSTQPAPVIYTRTGAVRAAEISKEFSVTV